MSDRNVGDKDQSVTKSALKPARKKNAAAAAAAQATLHFLQTSPNLHTANQCQNMRGNKGQQYYSICALLSPLSLLQLGLGVNKER